MQREEDDIQVYTVIKLIKRLFIILNILLLLSLGVVYAIQGNNLGILGIAHITGYDLNSDILPLYPVPWPDGSYFNSTTLPAALTHGEEDWIVDTFYLDIIKPPSVANNGMNNFTMTFQITNPTVYTWTAGQAGAVIVSGIYSSVSATLSAATVNPGGNVIITFSFRTKIDITSYDEARITVSYTMAGKPRYFYIDIVMRPA
ncbi:MAG: hypothetical protein FWG14_08030 [Peptococcaceae bacterium]|nr:hypothetical protein [Peptococcaceae bacterium]